MRSDADDRHEDGIVLMKNLLPATSCGKRDEQRHGSKMYYLDAEFPGGRDMLTKAENAEEVTGRTWASNQTENGQLWSKKQSDMFFMTRHIVTGVSARCGCRALHHGSHHGVLATI